MVKDIAGDNTRFNIEDLLFSRTDDRGVIRTGNAAFQEISVYSWDTLEGAPHKIVRHPEMPKGVFFLLWRALKAKQPIGGYVQNMAEDGVPYWVFATMLPMEDSYISVRMKPTGPTLEKLIPLYQRLHREEKAGSLTPEESAGQIEAFVEEQGFSEYMEFVAFSLREEAAARSKSLHRPANTVAEKLAEMFGAVRQLETHARRVEATFRQTHQIPYNMRLQAGRLEGSDGPISVISSNHRQMTQTLEENLGRFSRDSAVGAESIRAAMFKTCTSNLLEELCKTFSAETEQVPGNKEFELSSLHKLASMYTEDSLHEVRSLLDKVRRFGGQCRDMQRMMSGLELTRIMCKIERSKFDGEHAGLDEIVNRLADAQTSLGKNFDEIQSAVDRILSRGEEIQRAFASVPKMAMSA